MKSASQATLLVFTLGPGRESARRRWLSSEHRSLEKRLHETCLESLLEAGRAAGCELRLSTPDRETSIQGVSFDRQFERGFAERFAGAVRRAETGSFGPLVVVGTDCPDVSTELIETASERVRADPERVVIGPTSDGGMYLLASSCPLADQLTSVPWRTNRALDAIVSALELAGLTVELLPTLCDLDGRRDFERWIAALGENTLFRTRASAALQQVHQSSWSAASTFAPPAERSRSATSDRAPPLA